MRIYVKLTKIWAMFDVCYIHGCQSIQINLVTLFCLPPWLWGISLCCSSERICLLQLSLLYSITLVTGGLFVWSKGVCWEDSLIFWLSRVQSGLVSQECDLCKCFCSSSRDRDIFPFALNLFPDCRWYTPVFPIYVFKGFSHVVCILIFLGELEWNRIPQLQLEWDFTVTFWKCPPWRLSLRKGLKQFHHDCSSASAMAPRGTFSRFSLIHPMRA